MSRPEPKFSRVLVKLSGEALGGKAEQGIEPEVIQQLAIDLRMLTEINVQIALVIGGGNILRGAGLALKGVERVTADYMGMLATVINALALQDALERQGLSAPILSAIPLGPLCESYDRRQAIHYLERNAVVIFAAGTGNPLFTTDSAASLRAIEIKADLLIKATKVDGIFSADPVRDAHAKYFPRLTYDEVLSRRLSVMDATAIILCRDHDIPLRVINMHHPRVLIRTVMGEEEGTLVENSPAG